MFLKKFDRHICDRIIDWFIYTPYAKEMDNCLNGIDEYHPNPYHQERSVLDHALMVSSEAIKYWKDDKDFYIYFLAGLVHDIGKIRARSVEKRNKNSEELMCIFRNHESMGLYLASDIMIEFWKTDMAREINFSYFDYVNILNLVVYHDIYKYTPEQAINMYGSFAKKIAKFSICDTRGRLIDEPRDLSKYEDIINNDSLDYSGPFLSKIDEGKMYTIYFYIGLPSSGKSSLAEPEHYSNIISRDEIIENLEKYLNNNEYDKAIGAFIKKELMVIANKFKTYKERFDALHFKDKYGEYIDKIFMHKYHNAIMKYDGDILIDKTNLSKKSRSKLLTFNNKNTINVSNRVLEEHFNRYNKEARLIVRPYKSIINSDLARGRKAGKYVIDNFISSSNIPNLTEFDRISVFTPCIVKEIIEEYGEKSNQIKEYVFDSYINKDNIASLRCLSYWFIDIDIDKDNRNCMEMYDGYVKLNYKDSYIKLRVSI